MPLVADGIITDEPEMTFNLLTARSGLSPAERLLVHAVVLLGRPVPPRICHDLSP